MSINQNNCHIFGITFTILNFKLTSYKLSINIMNWYYAIFTNVIKIISPKFNITAIIIIVNSTIKSFLIIR